jgi:hypothetical protein
MSFILQVLLWGLVAGVIHFIITSLLYQNPLIAKYYARAQADNSPGVRKWSSQKGYILRMFSGTQVEIYVLTASFLFLRQYLNFSPWGTMMILGVIFSGIRVYPRFWNMWIQSTYPRNLLAIEFVNGVISTFTVVVALTLLPIK